MAVCLHANAIIMEWHMSLATFLTHSLTHTNKQANTHTHTTTKHSDTWEKKRKKTLHTSRRPHIRTALHLIYWWEFMAIERTGLPAALVNHAKWLLLLLLLRAESKSCKMPGPSPQCTINVMFSSSATMIARFYDQTLQTDLNLCVEICSTMLIKPTVIDTGKQKHSRR